MIYLSFFLDPRKISPPPDFESQTDFFSVSASLKNPPLFLLSPNPFLRLSDGV